jgi:hypothetical protein
MRNDDGYAARLVGFGAAGTVVALVLISVGISTAQAEEVEAGVSFDGLERVENSKVAKAYIDPNADFSVFKRVKTSAGAATLYLELYDSVSGDIIGRAADRQAIRSASDGISWRNRATNSADARRMFRRWANLLRSFLDQHYTK